ANVRSEPSIPVVLELGSGLPAVVADAQDLKRLFVFLVKNAVGAVALTNGEVTVRTQPESDNVEVRVDDTGPSIAPEQVPQFFDPGANSREGMNSLELAACKTIVRRLGGTIRAENRSEGGVAVTVRLPCSG